MARMSPRSRHLSSGRRCTRCVLCAARTAWRRTCVAVAGWLCVCAAALFVWLLVCLAACCPLGSCARVAAVAGPCTRSLLANAAARVLQVRSCGLLKSLRSHCWFTCIQSRFGLVLGAPASRGSAPWILTLSPYRALRSNFEAMRGHHQGASTVEENTTSFENDDTGP